MDKQTPTTIEVLGGLQTSIDSAVDESSAARTELTTVRTELEAERWWRRLLVKLVGGLFIIILVLMGFVVYNQRSTQHTASAARRKTFTDLVAIENDLAASKISQAQIHQIAVEIQAATSPEARAQGNVQTAKAVHDLEIYIHTALQAFQQSQPIPEPPPLAAGG